MALTLHGVVTTRVYVFQIAQHVGQSNRIAWASVDQPHASLSLAKSAMRRHRRIWPTDHAIGSRIVLRTIRTTERVVDDGR